MSTRIMLCFISDLRIGLTIVAYFARMCHRLALSAVSSHVLVLLLILGSV
jgi:hypothetical protein